MNSNRQRTDSERSTKDQKDKNCYFELLDFPNSFLQQEGSDEFYTEIINWADAYIWVVPIDKILSSGSSSQISRFDDINRFLVLFKSQKSSKKGNELSPSSKRPLIALVGTKLDIIDDKTFKDWNHPEDYSSILQTDFVETGKKPGSKIMNKISGISERSQIQNKYHISNIEHSQDALEKILLNLLEDYKEKETKHYKSAGTFNFNATSSVRRKKIFKSQTSFRQTRKNKSHIY